MILIRKIFLFLLPVFILVVCYIITDPYQNIWPKKVYLYTYLNLSRGNESTKVYLKNRKQYHYDSFIFGSSRSSAYSAAEWSKYLPAHSSPFLYGAWADPIEGEYRRLKLIDSLGDHIKNAFVLIDADNSFRFNGDIKSMELSTDHYLITGFSKYDYYMNDLVYYLKNPTLIRTSLDYAIFHKRRPYMYYFMGMKPGELDPVNNDWKPNSEKAIIADSANYYKDSLHVFYTRPKVQIIANRQINAVKKDIFFKMKAIFDKNKTSYRIVIGPLYDQVKLNPEDLKFLTGVFGKENVFDYSGINSITQNKFYYNNDAYHYRKKAGNLIFKLVYSKVTSK